jgi:hypothetical protein
LNFKSVQDSRKSVLFELNVDNGTNDGTDWRGKGIELENRYISHRE